MGTGRRPLAPSTPNCLPCPLLGRRGFLQGGTLVAGGLPLPIFFYHLRSPFLPDFTTVPTGFATVPGREDSCRDFCNALVVKQRWTYHAGYS